MIRFLTRIFVSLSDRHPRYTVVGFFLLFVLLAVSLVKLRVSADDFGSIVDNPQLLKLNSALESRYLNEDSMAIILGAENVYTRQVIQLVRTLGDRFEKIKGVSRVLHMGNIKKVNTDGMVEMRPVLRDEVLSNSDIDLLRTEIESSPFYRGRLVSLDRTSTVIVVMWDTAVVLPAQQSYIVDSIDDILASVPKETISLHVAGVPEVMRVVRRIIRTDVLTVYPAVLAALLLVGLLFFRSWYGAILPAISAGFAIVISLAAKVPVNSPFQVITVLVGPVVMASTCSYCIHLIEHFREELLLGAEGAVRRTVEALMTAMFVAAGTTVIGLASLSASRIDIITEFGIYSGIGLIAGWLCAALFVPAALRFAMQFSTFHAPRHYFIDRFLDRHVNRVLWHRKRYALAVIIASVIIGYGVRWLPVAADQMTYFKSSEPIYQAYKILNTQHEGNKNVTLEIDTGRADGVLDMNFVKVLDELTKKYRTHPDIVRVTSPLDYIGVLNRAMLNDEKADDVPQSPEAMAQLLLMLRGEPEIRSLIDANSQYIRLFVYTSLDMSSRREDELYPYLEGEAKKLLPYVKRISALGYTRVLDYGVVSLVRGQIYSLAVAIAIISLLLLATFRSIRMAMVALIPNALPCLLIFGVMGWFGIPLNVITATVACTVLGISVDDTIHTMARFYEELRKSGHFLVRESLGVAHTNEQTLALTRAICSTGRGTIIAGAVLSAGFLCLVMSGMLPLQQMGILGCTSMVICAFSDLVVLPLLLITVKI